MQAQVRIHGNGVAAACCARLLQEDAIRFSVARTPLRHSIPVLLSTSTQSLLIDLVRDPTLFHSMPVIRRRHVLWGVGSEAVMLPHAAVVASEADLLPQLWATVQDQPVETAVDAWNILGQSLETPIKQHLAFGSRMASISTVELKQVAAGDACWMESVPSGWLFLFATSERTAALVSVGECAQSLLAESRMVAAQISNIGAPTEAVSCAPRILSHLTGERWLACGSAAMTFDPVCGEGAGNAAREAILASAVVRAALRGENTHLLCRYYEARMTLGFLRHLEACRQFYATAGTGDFWQTAVEDLQKGISLLSKSVNVADASLYRLAGFGLETNTAGVPPLDR